MKNLIIFLLSLICFRSSGQNINWNAIDSSKSEVLFVDFGIDHGIVTNIGVAKYFSKPHLFPFLLNLEYSAPVGKILLDDFKTKTGGQVRLLKCGNLIASAEIQGIFRRFQNDYVRLLNFGSEMGFKLGYYSPKWFIGGECKFDKAIVTHFQHSDKYKGNYPEVQDGWFEPVTGGLFSYGFIGGAGFSNHNFNLRAGWAINQDFKTSPNLPIYLRLGYNYFFKLKLK